MSEIKKCEGCGREFESVSDLRFCIECITSDDDFFKVIRAYLYDNPGASIAEVAMATKVNESKILAFLRQGRVETVGSRMLIRCEKCGAGIPSGQFCAKCESDMSNQFKSTSRDMRSEMRRHESKTHSKGMHSKQKKK